MPRVIVSSGHTSDEPGIVVDGLREFDIASSIAKKVTANLRKTGVMTLAVPPDTTIVQRIDWVNNLGAKEETGDVAIEIHLNDGGKRGTEIWFKQGAESTSKKLAQAIADEIHTKTKLPRLGVKPHTDHLGGTISFIDQLQATSCLIKCAVLDNKDDAKFLDQEKNLDAIAKAISDAVSNYVKGLKITPPKLPTYTPPGQVAPGNNLSAPGTLPNNANMSREDRKKMITDYYVKALGREPNQNDLNYFLNIAIGEPELIKKIVDSQEHADIIKARNELADIKKMHDEMRIELELLRANAKDHSELMRTLQQSLMQKNHALQAMQQRMNYILDKARHLVQNNQIHAGNQPPKYKGTLLDRLFKSFSDLFE